MKLFENRKLIIATKHQKENVIAPILEKHLGVNCFTNENFDTDSLGTFSGEIERESDPVTTARKKCLLAMEMSGCDLGIASEGSFGPHPSIYFVSADDEFLIFIDKKNDLEIIARELSLETNFNGQEIKTESELLEFAKNGKFPTHGLILRRSKNDNENITKGITDIETLKSTFHLLRDTFNSAYVETDMRAMYNPSRMAVIVTATKKLIKKINSCCPECDVPGFAITDAKKGLPCDWCGTATNSILSYIYVCKKCQFTKEDMYPHNKQTADAGHCSYCNP